MYKQLERYRQENIQIRIAKYVRCSSDEQKKNGYTINDQLDLLEEFSQEYELVGAGVYVDEGVSATLEINKRKALSKLIKDAKAGKFDIVIFKCIDRFFRNVGEYYECQKQLQKAGVTWISIEESDLDPEDDDAAFKINIYLTMAEYEAKKTSKRIKFNNKMRIKNKQVVTGEQCFLFPWKVSGEKRNKHLEKNEDNAHILFDLLDFFETHESKRATLVYINMKYNMDMSITTITKILSETLLYGEYKGVPEYVEPYITKERFDAIQAILKRNAKYYEKSKNTFLFSGIVKCHSCGRNLAGNYKKPDNDKLEGYKSYRCNKHRQSGTCENHRAISETKIEKQLLANLDLYITNEIAKIESIEEVVVPKTDNTKKIDKLKKEMDRLNVMFRKGRIEEEEYDKEYFALEKDLKLLEAREEKPEERDLEKLKGLLETDYKALYEELDKEHRKAFWRKLIKEFSIDENRKIDPDSIVFF
jgi:DNA invertase Pin-like site-specific DNA recombinase